MEEACHGGGMARWGGSVPRDGGGGSGCGAGITLSRAAALVPRADAVCTTPTTNTGITLTHTCACACTCTRRVRRIELRAWMWSGPRIVVLPRTLRHAMQKDLKSAQPSAKDADIV